MVDGKIIDQMEEESDEEEEDTFPDGSIEKIYFIDFLTYVKVIVEAGRNLNLIIGANGSGKSSIICGICLAVGGSPKSLGRSENVGDFVRHGMERGTVEVFIADSKKGTQSFKVEIIRATNKCEYYINGSKTTLKDVKELAISYNIQIDNPCTFLAQDKVKSFSEQNPVELLRNTEKAGDPRLLELHDELIKKREENKFVAKQKEETELQVTNMKAELEGLKTRVENYKQQQLQDSKINAISSKLVVRDFEKAVGILKEKTNALKKLEKKLGNKQQQAKTLEEEVKRLNEMGKQYTMEEMKLKKQMIDLKAGMSAKIDENTYQRQVHIANKDYESAVKMYNNYEQEMNDLQVKLDNYEKEKEKKIMEIQDLKSHSISYESLINGLNDECEKIDNQIFAKQRALREIRRKADELTFEEKRKSPYDERLSELNNTHKDECTNAAYAFNYLTRQGINFHVPYFELVVKRGYTLLIDNLVQARDLLMFIFENKEDEEKAASIPDFKINTTVMRPEDVNNLNVSARLPSKYTELGFQGYAVELVQGPEVILNYLCNVSGLHRVPVTLNNKLKVENSGVATTLLNDGLNRYVVGNQLSSCFISKYSGKMVTQCRPIVRAKLLFAVHEKQIDMQNDPRHQKKELEQQQDHLNSEIRDLKQLHDNKTSELQINKEKQKEVKELEYRLRSFEGFIDRTKDQLKQMKIGRYDLDTAKREQENRRKVAAKSSLEEAQQIIEGLEKLIKLKVDKTIYETARSPIDDEKTKIQKKEDKAKQDLKEFTEDMQRLEDDKKIAKRKLDDIREKLIFTCGIPTLEEAKLNSTQKIKLQKLKERFLNYDIETKTNDELLRELAEEQATKKMRVVDGSSEDLDKYKALQNELAGLEQILAKQNEILAKSLGELQEDVAKWRILIEKLVTSINENYQKFFAEIKCIGEVHLEVPQNELEISQYGIMIMVSFRSSEKVRRLDHQVQSGGERSVSTMLYLLALQELCPVPFRCVDEINQGMDPTNERKVFEIMVKTLTGSGNLAKTQYFLLTPKLLKNLPYNEKVTVQVVHNSTGICFDAFKFPTSVLVRNSIAAAHCSG